MTAESGNGTTSANTIGSSIAIVGVGCRFPGNVRNLDSFGRLLSSAPDVFTEVPETRWGRERSDPAGGPGTISNGMGAFLDEIDRFDAPYFGVTPREANLLDPQQRLILEVAWEAMADSGRTRESWRGSRTAVLFGLLAKDYELLHARTLGIGEIGQHHVGGLEFSFAAGRLAYTFDLHGPVSAVNSACSSSLLAVHQACQSLRAGDCDTAVAGGVSLLITPDISVFLSRVGAISPSGRCRPFDASADGIVRGEGAGAVVLKRLADAVADDDRIYAVIRGSAANNDGTSLGLTVPNSVAQTALLKQALERSGLCATDVDYVEAHGTGTAIGDVMELDAIGEAYGTGRDAGNPLLVGSHKALLGHMDAAAGIGGLLKSTWVVHSGTIPRQPHVDRLNPAVDWRDGAVSVPLAHTVPGGPDDPDRVVRAGVSAFGLSGTNVHVIVESPPAPRGTAPAAARPQPYVLFASASTPAGLTEQIGGIRELVARPDEDLAELAATTATRRTHEAYRHAVVADSREQALRALADSDEPQDGAFTGVATDPDCVPEPVFVYSGDGGRWAGTVMDLYDGDVVVRDTLDECAELVRAEASWSLVDALRGDGPPERIEAAQPAALAVQVALTRWLAARGITPGAVVGHGSGEIAAAHAAGCLSLPDAVRLVVRRAELLGEAAGRGVAYAVRGDEAAVGEVLAATGLPVAVVAVDGPGTLVVAGPTAEAAQVAEALEARGMRCRRLEADTPAYGPPAADLGPRLEAALSGLTVAAPTVRMLSTVDPDAVRPTVDAAYWARNLTGPVRLWPVIDRLLAADDHPLVEIGPHPLLVPALAEAQRHHDRQAPALSLLDRHESGRLTAHKALARLHVAGTTVDWDRVTGRPRRYRTLPVPSWGGGRYWLPGVERGQQGITDPKQATGPATGQGTALPARIRISLLDADDRVTGEMYAQPDASFVPAPATAPAAGTPDRQPAVPARRPAVVRSGHSPARRVAALTELVTSTVRQLLGLPDGQAVPRRRGLFEQGLDSLTAVALRTRLGEELGITLPAPIVFERPTIAGLAEYLAEVAPHDTAPAAATPFPAQPVTAVHPAPSRPAATPRPAADPADDGIAVIGMSCRLPGAPSVEAFWELLNNRSGTASEFPAERGKDPAWGELDVPLPFKGSYLDDIAAFDAPFFRISPREAKLLDPQQRLFLEVAWEALADAGCPAHTLEEQPIGVYAGLSMADYQYLVSRDMDSASLNLYHGTGTSFAALAGRLSYVLGLRGPSMTVDTACSASLTAVHLACQALRTGDCEVAVVGGASAIVAPSPLIASMAASGALSADGRCKAFDEDADGFGCGEGAVVLVLKPVAAAERDGDRVYAVLRGSAVNQDGATGGLTVPNAAAQVDVVRKAVERAGWAPRDVDYVEAHGTGTPLGDPIEVRALVESLGTGRGPHDPLLIGSAKANVGHLGAAAGAVGLMKVVLALRHGVLPPHLVSTPSSRIEWDTLPVRLVDEACEWPDRGRPARAGVSAFGFSGSNAHVVAEQFVPTAPARPTAPAATGGPHLLLATAAGPAALREVARQLATELRFAPESAEDIVFTATRRRSLLEHRIAVTAPDTAALVTALQEIAAGRPSDAVHSGRVTDGEERTVAFRYGAGTPSAATRALWSAADPGYAATLDRCARALEQITGTPCDLYGEPGEELRAAHLFSHQAAATEVWRQLGLAPQAVTGEGAGRVTAAWAAGDLDLPQALRLLVEGDPAATDTDEDAATACDVVVDVLRDGDAPLGVAAGLFAAGVRPVAPGPTAREVVSLPAYPWEHDDYWYREFTAEPTVPWVLSADSAAELRTRAGRLAAYANGRTDLGAAGVGAGLAGRPVSGHRLVVVGEGVGALAAGLGEFAGSGAGVGVVSGVVPTGVVSGEGCRGPVFVFPGQGWQWVGMGRELLTVSPVFAAVVERCSVVVSGLVGWSVKDVLGGVAGAPGLERVDVVQPVMFTVMVGLAEVWRSMGVEPGAVVGHSQGEIAAACVAGVLSVEDAMRVVVARSAALVELAGTGGMASVSAGVDRVEGWLASRWEGRLWVAAVNGPGSVVVAGVPEALTELAAFCEEEGVRARVIPVDYASHTPLVEPIRGALAAALGVVQPVAGRVPLYSTLSGSLLDNTAAMDADYWFKNLRAPVRFEEAVRALVADGFSIFIETSAHPVLTVGIGEVVEDYPGRVCTVTGTLRRDDGGLRRLLTSAATLWTAGTDIDWNTLTPTPDGGPVKLPADLWGEPERTQAPSAASLEENRFWRIVERGDGQELAEMLGLGQDADRSSMDAFLPVLSQWWQKRRETEVVNSWRYRVVWRPMADVRHEPLSGTWLVVVPRDLADDDLAVGCAKAVSEAGGNPVMVPVNTAAAEHDGLAGTFRMYADPTISGVLSLLALDESPHPEHPVIPAGLLATVRVLQAMEEADCDARLWSVTSGAVAVGPGETVTHPTQAHLWGLNRVAALENPARWAGLIDLPANPDPTTLHHFTQLLTHPVEDQTAIRNHTCHTRRLTPTPTTSTPTTPYTPTGTVLITGGTGALGAHTARWLARKNTPHLLLLNRQGPNTPHNQQLRNELLQLGAQHVTITTCDTTNKQALATILANIPAQHPLTTVIHTAGVVDDGPVNEMTAAQMETVLLPKSQAVQNLHELTADLDLTAFVLFSSCGGLLPNVGQGAYAAGNAYLDAFAEHRRSMGLPATSVAWGAWAGKGMAEKDSFVDWIGRGGMDLMTPHLAVTGLQQALDHGDTTVVVANVDWERFARRYHTTRAQPLVSELVELDAVVAAPEADEASGLARLTRLPEEQRRGELLDIAMGELATVLGHSSPKNIMPDAAFKELGIDSVTAIELRNRITKATGLRFSPIAVFDHPTSEALTEHLLGRIPGGEPSADPGSPAPTAPEEPQDQSEFDAMTIEDLVRMAHGDNGS